MHDGSRRTAGNRQNNLYFNRPAARGEETGGEEAVLSVAWQAMAHPIHLPQSSIGGETNAASRTKESESADLRVSAPTSGIRSSFGRKTQRDVCATFIGAAAGCCS